MEDIVVTILMDSSKNCLVAVPFDCWGEEDFQIDLKPNQKDTEGCELLPNESYVMREIRNAQNFITGKELRHTFERIKPVVLTAQELIEIEKKSYEKVKDLLK